MIEIFVHFILRQINSLEFYLSFFIWVWFPSCRPFQNVRHTDIMMMYCKKRNNKLEAGHLIGYITHADHSIEFLLFVTLWPWPLAFDLILGLTDRRELVMDYTCAKFGDFIFSCFCIIARTHTDTQTNTHRIPHIQTPLNALLQRLSSAWVNSVK